MKYFEQFNGAVPRSGRSLRDSKERQTCSDEDYLEADQRRTSLTVRYMLPC